jgi:hypothetical protein
MGEEGKSLTRIHMYERRGRNRDVAVVRLTKKFADMIDGIDLTQHEVGDLVALSVTEARLLVAEGWAELISEAWSVTPPPSERAVAADRFTRPRTQRKNRLPRGE